MIITNKHNLPEYLTKAIIGDEYGQKENRYSITSLIKPTTIATLEKRYFNEIEIDAIDLFYSFIGRSIHAEIEKFSGEGAEKKIEIEKDGVTIVGKIDLIANKIITDYKTTSVWSYIFSQKKQDKPDWYRQLNCYRYLAYQEGIKDIEKLQIVCIFLDWQKKEAKKNPDYPQIPIAVIDIQPADINEVEQFILNRIKLLKEAENLPDDNLPICTPQERWQRESVYAVRRTNQKQALRLFKNEQQVKEFINMMMKLYGGEYDVDFREGEDIRCLYYCNVARWCPYGKTLKKEVNKNDKMEY